MSSKWMWLMVAVGLAVSAYALLVPGSLTINGKTVATDYLTKNGKTYVPLADVAKALNMAIAKKGDGYELTPAGGANQVQGLNGGIGQTLSCGKFTLKVVSVYRGERYTKEFNTPGEVTPMSTSEDVVAIKIRLKNATPKAVTMSPFGGDLTALTDEGEHAYKCFTGGAMDASDRGPKLLPGSAYDFALTFSIPKSAALKDLVYQMYCYDLNESSTFRISLKENS